MHFAHDPFTTAEAWRLYAQRVITADERTLLATANAAGPSNEDARCEACHQMQPHMWIGGRALCGRCGSIVMGVN
jgi:uncharacterized paraquat-inducible protein A